MSQKDKNLEDEFEAFLKQSLSSGDASFDSRRFNRAIDTSNEDIHDSEDLTSESSVASVSPRFKKLNSKFLKIPKKLESSNNELQAKNEDVTGAHSEEHDINEGEDTLKDKEKFFKALEQAGHSSLNFSLLNKQLEDSSSIPSFLQHHHQEVENDQEEALKESEEPNDNSFLKESGDHLNSSRTDSSSERKSKILEAINKRYDLIGAGEHSGEKKNKNMNDVTAKMQSTFLSTFDSLDGSNLDRGENGVKEGESVEQDDADVHETDAGEHNSSLEDGVSIQNSEITPEDVSATGSKIEKRFNQRSPLAGEVTKLSDAETPTSSNEKMKERMQFQNKMEMQQIEEDYFKLKFKDGDSNETEMKQDKTNNLEMKFLELEAEIKHQDFLIRGYQAENEKLYLEVKKAKEVRTDQRDKIVQENVKLKTELLNVREQLEMNIHKLPVDNTNEQKFEEKETALKNEAEQLHGRLEAFKSDNDMLQGEIALLKNLLKSRESPAKTPASPAHESNIKRSLIPVSRDVGKQKKSEEKSEINEASMIKYLEGRVKKLEDDLKRKEQDSDQSLKLLQEKFFDIKKQYDDHLKQLEDELEEQQQRQQAAPPPAVLLAACSDASCQARMNHLELVIVGLKNDLHVLNKNTSETKKFQNDEVVNLNAQIGKFHQDVGSFHELMKENSDLKVQIASMRGKYEVEMEKLQSLHAAKTSSLQNRLISQESTIRKLQEDLKSVRLESAKLAAKSESDRQLEEQIVKLEAELKEAKTFQSPNMKHYNSMKSRITDMELRLQERDQQLNDFLRSTSSKSGISDTYSSVVRALELKHREETEKWKSLVAEKVEEIDTFRKQLDVIFEFLKKLKLQNLAIPQNTVFDGLES